MNKNVSFKGGTPSSSTNTVKVISDISQENNPSSARLISPVVLLI